MISSNDDFPDFATFGSAKQRAFLAAYRVSGTIRSASEKSGVSTSSHYRWLQDESYSEQFRLAQLEANDALEDEARRRAVDGWDEPVFYEGRECGTKRKYSDGLLLALLKANNPGKFGDKIEQVHKGQIAAPVQVYLPEKRSQLLPSTNGNGHSNGHH